MTSEKIPYNYPLRESTTVVVLRIVLTQLVIGLSGLLINAALFLFLGPDSEVVSLPTAVGISTLALQTIDGLVLIAIVMHWATTTYQITPEEIIIQRGIFYMQRLVYKTARIESVNVYQTFLGKLFNYGTIKFYNPVLKEDVYLQNIPEPHVYSEVIKRTESKEAIRFLPPRHDEDQPGSNLPHHP